jgi:hypothetical protein
MSWFAVIPKELACQPACGNADRSGFFALLPTVSALARFLAR